MSRPKGILNYSSPRESAQRLAYARHKAQAKHRGEPYTLEFEDYTRIWGEQFEQRGKSLDSMCMSRHDTSQGWTVDNTYITTRREHIDKLVAMPKATAKGLDEWEIPDEIRHKL